MSTNWNSRGIILSIPQCFANQRWQLPWKSHSSDHEFYIMLKNLRKVIQKRVYDVLSHKYGIFMVIAAAVILIVAALHFGEVRKSLFLIFQRGRGVIFRRFPNWIDFKIYLTLKFCISHCHMINVININLFKTIMSRSLVHVLYHHQYM